MDALLQVSVDGFKFDKSCCNKPRKAQQQVSSDDFADLKYIDDLLMMEEGHSCVSQDSLALQAAERSFYQLLYNHSPPSDPSLSHLFSTSTTTSSHHPSSDLTDSGSPNISLEDSQRSRYHHRDDDDDDAYDDDDDRLTHGRIRKQPAIYLDMELPEMFEELLSLCTHNIQEGSPHSTENLSHRNRTRRPKGSSKPQPVDVQSLLMQCAQAVASFDHKTAKEKLKEIRSHSPKHGNASQRLAFHFAEGLESRIAGGTPSPLGFYPFPCGRTSMVHVLNAYKLFVQACPATKMSFFIANKTIFEIASKATRLHIIDFGILHGFQWPCLIQTLSSQPGGPPLLRITGIELPQPGFRPSEQIEETGRRLKRLCDSFNVPFEYNFIAKKWESINLDDLAIDREETTVVNCQYRLRYTPDETVSMNSPRDKVLKLFRDIRPDLFVFAEINGMYNSPFFVARFREALFHFSSIFDMFEVTMKSDDKYRTLLEKELCVRDAVNVIASEGSERVDRPETYKQWQVRITRAGFKPVKLNKELTKEAKEVVRKGYHRDFVIDADSHWLLQGWKGRVLYALSCWKPAQM